MANKTLNVRIQNKYDTEANWASKNPVLLKGEAAYSSDKNGLYKIGDGTSKWSDLKYNSANTLVNHTSGEGFEFGYANSKTITIPKTTAVTTYYIQIAQKANFRFKNYYVKTSGNNTQYSFQAEISANAYMEPHVTLNTQKYNDSEVKSILICKNSTNSYHHDIYLVVNSSTSVAKTIYIWSDNTILDTVSTTAPTTATELNVNITNDSYIYTSKKIQANITGSAGSVAWGNITGKPSTYYTHPSYTARSSGLYKVTVDATGHVSGATAVSKADITALGIPGSDTNTWRGIQNNLTSTATDQSLSAAQGKILNELTFQKKKAIDATVDWDTLKEFGCYKIQMASWGDAATKHSPNAYGNVYQFGLLLVFRGYDADSENRTVQIYIPHKADADVSSVVLMRMLNGTGWQSWHPLARGTSWGDIINKPTTFTPSSHTHDDRYYTESEINGKLAGYLPLSGGSMTGNIKFNTKWNNYIGEGNTDNASAVGGDLNNLVIASWWGVSFTTPCANQKYTNKTAVGIDCRNGIVKAAEFRGAFTGTASTATALTTSAGSSTQPIYFSSGKPVATTYQLNASVPAGAKFTDTNTWRPLGTTADTACAGNDSRLSNARPASDVYSWAKASSKPSYSWSEIGSKPSTFTPSSHTHETITGKYTGNGGQQNPSYISNGIVRFNMMNTNINNDTSYKDFILMDTYAGNDVPYVTALGLSKTASAKAFIMAGKKGGSSWDYKAELLSTSNYTSYTVTKSGSGASGTWGINVTGSAGSVAWGNVSGRPSSMPASDVYSWAKASSKPSYSWNEISGKPGTFNPSSHNHTDLDTIGTVGYYGSNVANSNGWYKVYSTTLTNYNDHVARLSIVSGYNPIASGLLTLHLRCDNTTSLKVRQLIWETRQGFNADDVIINTNGNTWTLYLKITNSQYGRVKIRVLESMSTSSNWSMSLSNNSTKESTNPKATATAKDGATVSYANSAGSVTWSGISGKPSLVGKTIKSLTAASSSGWSDLTSAQNLIPDMSVIAYWNGAYSNTSSNLAYCNKGAFGTIVTKNAGDYATAGHTHHYAGSSSAGGSATSAVKLDTSTAGSATQPVYFTGGKPVACTYTLGKSVPSNAVFTDTNNKMTQTAIASKDYTNWRTILWGASNSGTEGFTPTTVTDGAFTDTNLSYQPSTGTLRAKVFKGDLYQTTTIGNSTATECSLNFLSNAKLSDGSYLAQNYRIVNDRKTDFVFGIKTKNNEWVSYCQGTQVYFKNSSADISALAGKMLPPVLTDFSGSKDSPGAGTGRVLSIASNVDSKIIKFRIFTSSTATTATTVNVSYSTSDIRLKDNVKDTDIKDALSVINKMKIRQFDWKDDNKHQKIGFVADELEELDDKLVVGGGWEDEDHTQMNVKGVDTFYMMGYVVKGMQELSEQIKALTEENKELKKQIEGLKREG